MTPAEFIRAADAAQIEQILETARQLRAAIPAGALSVVEAMRSDAARLLERAADLLGAARAAETRI